MKKLVLTLMSFLTLTVTAQVPTPTLYFTITSHNEPPPAEVYTVLATYSLTSDTLRKIVDMINTKNAKFNMQLNPNFVQGTLMHESAITNTNDVIQYAYNIGGTPGNVVQIDPRYKQTGMYNIADVSYSIELTGALASKNVGGFVALNGTTTPNSYTIGDWIPYTTTIQAQNTPTYSWKADVIWGAGSLPPHSNDANNYGIWKPRGKTDSVDFYCHDPAQNVWLQGNGCGWVLTPTTNVNQLISEIRTEATKIRNGTYPANKFYNGHLMINFRDFGTSTVTPTFQMRKELGKIIDSINVMVSQGKIAWKTITQKQTAFSAWSSTNSISYSQWRCGQTNTVTPTCAPSGIFENSTLLNNYMLIAPNPANNKISISWGGQLNQNTILEVYDNLGRRVYSEKMQHSITEVNVSQFSEGLYTIIVQNDAGQARPAKILIQH